MDGAGNKVARSLSGQLATYDLTVAGGEMAFTYAAGQWRSCAPRVGGAMVTVYTGTRR